MQNLVTKEIPVGNSQTIAPHLLKIQVEIYEALVHYVDAHAALTMGKEDLHGEIHEFVQEYANRNYIQINEKEQKLIAERIVHDMVGFGPLEEALADPSVNDILVNGPTDVYIEKNGILEKSAITFHDENHILHVAQRIVTQIGRRIDESSPMVDGRLGDGTRINVIIPPASLNGPVLSIRKSSPHLIDIQSMVTQKNIPQKLADFLGLAIACHFNILVSGAAGAGKTTLLNALALLIDSTERVVTIEDAAELRLTQPNLVRLESRPSNSEGKGTITIRELLRNALRMRPDRIIVGEVRGSETIDMLQALNTGHDGSMSTLHANRAHDSIARLENMIAMSDPGIPLKVIRDQIAGGVDLIIHIERLPDGSRRIREIIELTEMETGNDSVSTNEIYLSTYMTGEYHLGLGQFVAKSFSPKVLDKIHRYNKIDELKEIMGLLV